MKQQTLWENQTIVKDRQKILAYLAKCKEVLLGAARPHTGAWWWKQTKWNEYTLIGGRETHTFNDYRKLHKFCVANNIDATQV